MFASEFQCFSEIDYDAQDTVIAEVWGVEVCKSPGGHYFLNTDASFRTFMVLLQRRGHSSEMVCGHEVSPGAAYIWWVDHRLDLCLDCSEQVRNGPDGPCFRVIGIDCSCDGCMPSD